MCTVDKISFDQNVKPIDNSTIHFVFSNLL